MFRLEGDVSILDGLISLQSFILMSLNRPRNVFLSVKYFIKHFK